jgi:asparagine synthase (glutamine-hydrolysing)
MCGIAGVIDLYYSNAIAERMLNTMKRRGPDSNGIWETDMCMMLHSRLSIIDPQGGNSQ